MCTLTITILLRNDDLSVTSARTNTTRNRQCMPRRRLQLSTHGRSHAGNTA